ncbi:MAG: hypothetical protein AB1453_13980 [Chloroflexota bacterium]
MVTYLANAWSLNRIGLFDPCTDHNLKIAMEFAITQEFLPIVAGKIRQSPRLANQLLNMLGGQYPLANQWVTDRLAIY